MRFYSVAVAALTVDSPAKWIDNLLSQHVVSDVSHRERGVARGISWAGLVRIAIIWELHVRLGCGVRDAVALAGRLLETPDDEPVRAGALTVSLDRLAFERDLHVRLRDALESAPTPRRGRPPATGRGVRRHPAALSTEP